MIVILYQIGMSFSARELLARLNCCYEPRARLLRRIPASLPGRPSKGDFPAPSVYMRNGQSIWRSKSSNNLVKPTRANSLRCCRLGWANAFGITIPPPTGTGKFVTRVNQHCFYRPTELYAQT